MKNKKILGMPITIFVLGLLVIAGATASLVNYLSNETQMDVEVTSPFELYNAQGHNQPTATENTPDSGWTEGGSFDFGQVTAGTPILWTNKITNNAEMDITVNDNEVIYGEDTQGNPLTMDELNNQFAFFGARYWRPEGSASRLDDYSGDIELGYDPYTLNTDGVITCHGMGNSGYGADITDTSYVDIKNDICYYVDGAFNFAVNLEGDLESDFEYEYVSGFEETAEYLAIFSPATTPGSYHYERQILVTE